MVEGEIEQRKALLFSRLKGLFSSGADTAPASFRQKLASYIRSNIIYFILLLPVMWIAWYVRTRNAIYLQGKYLVELDSYFFYRYAKIILEQGALPIIDYVRYVPNGYPTQQFALFPHFLVWMYKIALIFKPQLAQITWHVYYPVVTTVISLIFFFLFVRNLFGNRVAIVSTAFLAIIPAYIQRTSAGFADHEAIAMLFMFAALWTFSMMWKAKDWKWSVGLGIITGLLAALTREVWGGYRFLTISVSLFVIAAVILKSMNKSQLLGYIGMMFAFAVFPRVVLSQLYTVDTFFIVAPLIYLMALALEKYPALNQYYQKNLAKYISIEALSALTIFILGGLVAYALGIITPEILNSALTGAGATRFGTTVSESQKPYFFGGWWEQFGHIFILAFIGSILLTYYLFTVTQREHRAKAKYAAIIAAAYAIFFLAFIFGRLGAGGKHPQLVDFFSATYIHWLVAFILFIVAFYMWCYYKKPDIFSSMFKNNSWQLLLIFIWFLISLVMGRSQIRLIFALAPAAAVAVGYLLVKASELLYNKNSTRWLTIVVILVAVLAFNQGYQNSKMANLGVQSMIPGQWEQAMNFLRDSTPKDSVIAHWWDYGHMTHALGERASVTDGGNLASWNHAMGRYALTGKDEQSTLTYLKTHNVTHLLISEEEIPKYHAFSLIGSDENLDRRSTFGIYQLQATQQENNNTRVIYSGSWPFDKDYIFGSAVLPESQAWIIGFTFLDTGTTLAEPKAITYLNKKQGAIDISCVYISNKRLEFKPQAPYLSGCLVIVPSFKSETDVNAIGAAMWLSDKVWDTNMARLYIYSEDDPNFKLVYSDNMPLGIYQGNIIGPIKIWQVIYPQNIVPDPFYLEPSEYG